MAEAPLNVFMVGVGEANIVIMDLDEAAFQRKPEAARAAVQPAGSLWRERTEASRLIRNGRLDGLPFGR